MGCDIHCYIEYREPGRSWWPFGGRINPGRNYALFEALAGVRGDISNALVEPRGMPEDAAYQSSSDNRLWISDSQGDGNTTMENAKKWVDSGVSEFVDGSYGKPAWVTNPDWHTHSWVTVQELEKAVGTNTSSPEYFAIIAAMKQFEAMGLETRMVFWFDN